MREFFSVIPYPVMATFVLLFVIGGIGFFGWQLSSRHGSDVRTIWYLYFLAVVSTCIVGAWGSEIGAIDASGSFQGPLGKNIDQLLHVMLDLNTDMMLFTLLAAIVLGPQFGSYLISGIFFGCAAPMRLVGTTFNLYIWSSAKSFVVTGGILQALSLYGWAHNWKGWTAKGATALSGMSMLLTMLAFCMMHIYRDITDQQAEMASNSKFARIKAWWHTFMTRRSGPLTHSQAISIEP